MSVLYQILTQLGRKKLNTNTADKKFHNCDWRGRTKVSEVGLATF